jgi:hypothetical protein
MPNNLIVVCPLKTGPGKTKRHCVRGIFKNSEEALQVTRLLSDTESVVAEGRIRARQFAEIYLEDLSVGPLQLFVPQKESTPARKTPSSKCLEIRKNLRAM